MGDRKQIWVLCETRNDLVIQPSLELISKARELADSIGWGVCAFLIASDVANNISMIENAGADRVYICRLDMENSFYDDVYVKTAVYYAKKYKPEIILTAATVRGRSIAPQVAMMLGTGLTADCTQLEIKENDILLQTRPAYSGNLIAEIVCEKSRPQMASVRPGVFAVLNKTNKKFNKIDVVNLDIITQNSTKVEVLAKQYIEENEKNLLNAEVIVAGGKGIGSREGFTELEKLAELLGGTTAASRSAVNVGYAPYYKQIGQTGSTVRPKIYIACGISGCVQHLAGMSSSGYIIAINNDRKAPIFNVCDYGIVGDWKITVGKLIENLADVKYRCDKKYYNRGENYEL